MKLTRSIVVFAIAAASLANAGSPQKGTEILWDKFGVAHVYAKNTEDLFYGYGWATAQSHGNLLMKLYGESRGRASEYFGPVGPRERSLGVDQQRPAAIGEVAGRADAGVPLIHGGIRQRH